MSASEFAEHLVVHGPLLAGQTDALLAGGIVAATVANCHRGSDTPPFTPGDFLPVRAGGTPPEAAREGSAADLASLIDGAARHGG